MLQSIKNKVIDDLSLAILQELSSNSRTTVAEIGRRVGLTAPAVAERISKLEGGRLYPGISRGAGFYCTNWD